MTSSDLHDQMREMGRAARRAANALAVAPAEQRSAAIRAMAMRLREAEGAILAANAADMEDATAHHDRLLLDAGRIESIAASLEQIAELPDPVGVEMDRWVRPNGLDIARVRTPIGVIGMIYEARPNVTADAAAICLRSGNAVILRSGSEAQRSAIAIHAALVRGLEDAAFDPNAVQIVATTDREAVGMLVTEGRPATVRLNPVDMEAMAQPLREEVNAPGVQWVTDAAVPPGGCLVESAGTVVDGSLDKRWARAIAVLGLQSPWEEMPDEAKDPARKEGGNDR